ncbi:emp24/gp25L/p24 family/GOLD-domain-containing protein, partial [Gilbertella persicaria]|uniref:emp24/gp25L/p24 family/GOLD-domain-containing protein n=1 Tax=Gilbertella persicaria TaxID=101096 RepID=UPI00221EF13A
MNRVLLLSALLFLQGLFAMYIDIQPGEIECFYEHLEKGEKMTVSYQVGEGGNLDIDFSVKDPADSVIISTTRTSTNEHTFLANIEGQYTYCFSNEFSSVTEKRVGFNVHENIQKIHDSVKEHTDPLEREIAELAESIFSVKAQQEYIVVRERQHRDTAESTNDRVKWWSIGQLGLLITVCLWQVYYLKRFFEVKRAV